jgi:hypothetical protein
VLTAIFCPPDLLCCFPGLSVHESSFPLLPPGSTLPYHPWLPAFSCPKSRVPVSAGDVLLSVLVRNATADPSFDFCGAEVSNAKPFTITGRPPMPPRS